MKNKKRNFRQENLGLDIYHLDGYRVVYEDIDRKKLKYIARLIDDDNNVIAISKTKSDNIIEAYMALIQNYLYPNNETVLKLDAIKKLYEKGMTKSNIAKTLNITRQSINEYFYYYNLDNRINLEGK